MMIILGIAGVVLFITTGSGMLPGTGIPAGTYLLESDSTTRTLVLNNESFDF